MKIKLKFTTNDFEMEHKVLIRLKLFFLIVCSFTLFFSNAILSKHACGIDLLKPPKRILVRQDNDNRRLLKEQIWEPIRIHFDLSYIENNLDTISNKDLSDLKEKILPKTQKIFENLLKVKRMRNKLKLNSPSCETFPIPDMYHHSGEGVDADIVIFVLIDNTSFFSENGIEAAALHCLQDQETRRPIAGYIQFKQNLNIQDTNGFDYYVWLALHEITHILVINRSLYEDYINSETLEPLGYDRVIGSKILENGTKMNYIKSKNVLKNSKKHFKCEILYGIPLEYNGGSGTAGSHWSKRYMNTDYMIGESHGENLISEITLGLFEDSGWYKVDFSLANLFIWGKDKGCEFFDREKKCIFPYRKDFKMGYSTKNNNFDYSDLIGIENKKGNSNVNNILKLSIMINRVRKNFSELKSRNTKMKKKLHILNKNATNISDSLEIKKNEFLHNSNENKNITKYILEYKTNYTDEFCVEFNKPVCSTSNLFRGRCIVEEFSEKLEISEIQFRNPFLGGSEKLTDRCPIPIEDRNKYDFYSGSCRYGEKFSFTKSFEKICPECACFMNNLEQILPNEKINKTKKFRTNTDKNEFIKENFPFRNYNQFFEILNDSNKKNNLTQKIKYEKITKFKKNIGREELFYSFLQFSINNDTQRSMEDKEEDEFDEYEVVRLNPQLNQNDYMASCIEYKCKNQELFIFINDKKYRCEEFGKITKIPGYTGGIKCPDKNVLCQEKFLCKFGCVEKFDNKIPYEKFLD